MQEWDETAWRQSMIQSRIQTTQMLQTAIARLQTIAQEVDIATLFSTTAATLLIVPIDQMSEATHGTFPAQLELLAFYLYSYIGTSNDTDITPHQVDECIQLLQHMLTYQTWLDLSSETMDQLHNPVDRIKREVVLATKIIRGSAYPEQTAREISEIQGHFEQWFMNKVGLGPTRAHDMLWAIDQNREDALQTMLPIIKAETLDFLTFWKKHRHAPQTSQGSELAWLTSLKDKKSAASFAYRQSLHRVAFNVLSVGYEQVVSRMPSLTREEWNMLIQLIGLTSENRIALSDPVDVRQKPLCVFNEDRVVLIEISHAMDALWDAFDTIAKQDQKFYTRYQKKRAQWLETTVIEHLGKVFPSQHIYRGLSYPNPDKTDGSDAELDGAILWGPFLVLIEVKAKQFRLEAQLGDVGRLRTDMKENIEDAFEQARRVARYITQTTNPILKEIATKRKLTIDKSQIQRTYLLTISQHHMTGLATRLASLRDLNLFRDAEYPLAICIADLEIVTTFCGGPDVFLHYIERRLELQQAHEEIHADELDFFGAYLDTRLQKERLWESQGKSFDMVALGGWSEQFDTWMWYRRGKLPHPPSIELDVPKEIHELLGELRNRDDDDARWIAFTLLDMSDDILMGIAKALQDIRRAKLNPDMFRRMTFQDGEMVVSLVASNNQPDSALYQRTQLRTIVEKYRRKTRKSIGFGIRPLNTFAPFEIAVWVEGEWQYDEALEQLVSSEPPYTPAPDQKLPGRNQPCLCGSGNKFKRCCLPKIEEARRMR